MRARFWSALRSRRGSFRFRGGGRSVGADPNRGKHGKGCRELVGEDRRGDTSGARAQLLRGRDRRKEYGRCAFAGGMERAWRACFRVMTIVDRVSGEEVMG